MRILEIIVPEQQLQPVQQILDKDRVAEQWAYLSSEGEHVIKALAGTEHVKTLLADLEGIRECRVVIYSVEGTLPSFVKEKNHKEDTISLGKFLSISKEELNKDVDEPVNLSANFILMVILSSFVAGIGILKGNIAIIIGAMVIAPFLGPNVSMAFGTTLGDWPMIRKSLITGIVATAIALFISMIWGYVWADVGHIIPDAQIQYQDILLALICGFAGVISVLGGQGSSLVGVMVAAALLPPLMRSGLLLGGGNYPEALNSMLIFMVNVIGVNIAGIITFYLAGVRPSRWWEKEKARKKTRTAFMIWLIALIIVVVVVWSLKNFFPV